MNPEWHVSAPDPARRIAGREGILRCAIQPVVEFRVHRAALLLLCRPPLHLRDEPACTGACSAATASLALVSKCRTPRSQPHRPVNRAARMAAVLAVPAS